MMPRLRFPRQITSTTAGTPHMDRPRSARPQVISAIALLLLFLSAPSAALAGVWPITGDANRDCKVDILDIILVRNRLNLDPSLADNWQADLNQDGKINILDIITVRNHLNIVCFVFWELRAMSWMCICEGATGLIYYTWEEMDKNPGMWDDLRRVATEIKAAFPMLLSADALPAITADAGTWLHWTARQYQGKTFIYAVNNGDGEGTATFHLPHAPAKITVPAESRTITPTGSDFSDAFAKLATRAYQVEW